MAKTITLNGDYGYNSYRVTGIESTKIDAFDASWIVSNMGSKTNLYPVSVYNSSDITLVGGTVNGEVPLNIDWTKAYVNSAAVYVRGTDNVLVQDWRITQAWDGIRVVGDKGDDFTIDRVWLSEIRDDAIENDAGLGGTISNSLFDGVFMGISTGNPGTADRGNVVTVDDVMIRMETYLYKGMDTHGSPFKVYDNSPDMKIYNSVFAIEEVNHRSDHALERAWEKTIDASGNYYLNLSDEPLPDNYPMPPKGFTILQGKEARAFWDAARSEQIAEITGGDGSAPAVSGGAAAVGGGAAAAVSGGVVPVKSGLVAAYGSGDVILGTGGRVTGWSDGSGRGNDLTAAGNPMLVADATPTGQDAIVFDGAGDLLNRNSALKGLSEGNADRTMFFVVNYIDDEGVASGLVYGDGAQNQAFGLVSKYGDEDLTVQGWGDRNDFDSNVDGPAQGWMVQSVVLDDGEFDHYRNGTRIDSGKHEFATDASRIVIGAEIAGLGESELEVGAALIYDRALTEPERMQVEEHLQTMYVDDIFTFG